MPNVISGSTNANSEDYFAIVVSRFNHEITHKLLDGALQTLYDHGAKSNRIDVIWVPGAWELPLATQRLAKQNKFAAIICLGAVIRGETTHDVYINHFVSRSLGKIGLGCDIPIAFGMLTCETVQQAEDRAGGTMGNKGSEAASAALEMAALARQIEQAHRLYLKQQTKESETGEKLTS